MSHAEYVAKLDEDQLANLIEQASARRENILQSGYVNLWTVNVRWANVAWFAEEDHAAAIEFACDEVKKQAAKRSGTGIEMEVSLERYRPSEVAELLASRPAAQMSAAIKKWEDRISAEWRAQWVRQGYNPTEAAMMGEIGELRAAVASHQGVAVPAEHIVPDWPHCNPGCDYEDPHGGRHDGRSAHCACEAAKASIARQRAAAPQPPAVKEADSAPAQTNFQPR